MSKNKAILMTHLVANYPNPETFENALETMLSYGVDFLEVQIPFSNPLADGETIYKANQQALKYQSDIESVMVLVQKVVSRFEKNNQRKITTKLLLMGYITTFLKYGIEKLVNDMDTFGFSGTIIPDLVLNSPEQKKLSGLLSQKQMYNIPVISPLTSASRLNLIKQTLIPNQPIYAMSRKGRTGNNTNISELQDYLDFLKENLSDYQIAVGFGIRQADQVNFLNNQGFIAVIGSKIIQVIDQSSDAAIELLAYLKGLET